MDIHKPHAAKNWKEFFIELGTIVLGIVIAIALEQLVEAWHWQSEVVEARKAIIAEMTAAQPLFARRLAHASCMNRQITETHAILDALEAGEPKPAFTTFHRSGGSALLSDSEWESDRAAQTLPHFPRAELAVLSRYYAQLRDFKSFLGQEGDAWSQLTAVTRPHVVLAQSDIARMRGSLDQAESYGRLITLNSGRMLEFGDKLGIARPTEDSASTKQFCEASDERFRSAVGR